MNTLKNRPKIRNMGCAENCDLLEWVRGFEKHLGERVIELKSQGDQERQKLAEFYTRLPTIQDPAMVITELQTHISTLIDHIIALHEFFDKEVLGE
jgi:hypothetical protein